MPPREHRTPLSAIELRSTANVESHSVWYSGFHSSSIIDSHPTRRKSRKHKALSVAQNPVVQSASSATEALNNVRDMLRQTETYNICLAKNIEVIINFNS